MRTGLQLWLGGLTVIVMTLTAPAAHGTWSVVIADTHTKELAAGIVTCNTGGELLPLVRAAVGKGVGICQAASDPDGSRRPIIFKGLRAGTAPQNVLERLSAVSEHERRQYGIADTQGRASTFTGSATAPWAGGVVGSQGTMIYAIQGNILAGSCVVDAIEQALRNAPGDIPAKLMAGMQAARLAGGDRRCSCPDKRDPAACGCPPSDFAKSGHRGGMLVARIGDPDHTQANCSDPDDGTLFMRLSVTYQGSEEKPDPVLQLQKQFDEWRAGLVGRPDAIQSLVEFTSSTVQRGGSGTARMLITLKDWRRRRVTTPISSLSVTHAPESAAISEVREIRSNADGSFTVVLTTGEGLGTDSFVVTVDDGVRPVILMPNPLLQYVGQPDP
jgi:hypothetical protein